MRHDLTRLSVMSKLASSSIHSGLLSSVFGTLSPAGTLVLIVPSRQGLVIAADSLSSTPERAPEIARNFAD